jgi:hypothetical protein
MPGQAWTVILLIPAFTQHGFFSLLKRQTEECSNFASKKAWAD